MRVGPLLVWHGSTVQKMLRLKIMSFCGCLHGAKHACAVHYVTNMRRTSPHPTHALPRIASAKRTRKTGGRCGPNLLHGQNTTEQILRNLPYHLEPVLEPKIGGFSRCHTVAGWAGTCWVIFVKTHGALDLLKTSLCFLIMDNISYTTIWGIFRFLHPP